MIEVLLSMSLLFENTMSFIKGTRYESLERTASVAQVTSYVSETDGFRFELAGCNATQNVNEPYTCNFLVENTGNKARDISIYGDVAPEGTSYIVDSQGITIPATSVTVAGNTQTFYAGATAQPRVPIRASLFLEAVPNSDIRFIELYCVASGGSRSYFSAKFLLN